MGLRVMVGQKKTPSPTASARVMADYEFTGEGGITGGWARGYTLRSSAVAPHSMAKTGHNKNNNDTMRARPNNHCDRTRVIQRIIRTTASGLGKKPGKRWKKLLRISRA